MGGLRRSAFDWMFSMSNVCNTQGEYPTVLSIESGFVYLINF
jgi:hypothetical protein